MTVLREALRQQAKTCARMGSPFTGRVLSVVADRLTGGTPLTDRLLSWRGDLSASGASVPLRLAGALHALVLEARDSDLAALYPPNPMPDDDALWRAIEAALTAHHGRIHQILDTPPQTNEVGRSAVLIAVGHWLAQRVGLPLVLSELGASAGLNLEWDRYALTLYGWTYGPADPVLTLAPDWTGALPPATRPVIAARRGVDLKPLDQDLLENRLRLRAYVWPDQADRMARTRAAQAIARSDVDTADVAPWLETRLKAPLPYPPQCHLIYHTVAWQYFPQGTKMMAQRTLEAAGLRATKANPLAWFGMEADGETPGAGLTLRLWPGNLRFSLGRADFHARWVDWRPEQLT